MGTAAQRISLLPASRYEMNQRRAASPWPELFKLLDTVKDPEIPVLSIWELGILQDVAQMHDGTVKVTITPTYSGCPAMQHIADDIQATLGAAGYRVEIDQRLSPAWTTDWMAPSAKTRLKEYGVAPPGEPVCPQCGSNQVEVISEFGSTSCKALLRCKDCAEPFDQFKRL